MRLVRTARTFNLRLYCCTSFIRHAVWKCTILLKLTYILLHWSEVSYKISMTNTSCQDVKIVNLEKVKSHFCHDPCVFLAFWFGIMLLLFLSLCSDSSLPGKNSLPVPAPVTDHLTCGSLTWLLRPLLKAQCFSWLDGCTTSVSVAPALSYSCDVFTFIVTGF